MRRSLMVLSRQALPGARLQQAIRPMSLQFTLAEIAIGMPPHKIDQCGHPRLQPERRHWSRPEAWLRLEHGPWPRSEHRSRYEARLRPLFEAAATAIELSRTDRNNFHPSVCRIGRKRRVK
jgi:hypothetical protein